MIYPVILCGGSGTRLWPVSRQSFPKQFSPLIGDQTPFQTTLSRLKIAKLAAPTIVTNDDYRFVVLDELAQINVEALDILLEPEKKDTAAAILLACLSIQSHDPDAIILVLPSDHFFEHEDDFFKAVDNAKAQMSATQFVTFGLEPHYAETGYGYLESAGQNAGGLQTLKRFVEKPSLKDAEEMIATGKYFWNSGVAMGAVRHFLEQFELHAPQIFKSVKASFLKAHRDLAFSRPDTETWGRAPKISFDYAVLENADDIVMAPLNTNWSDLGNWKSVWQNSPLDKNGLAKRGATYAVNCKNSLLRSDCPDISLIAVGLEDVFAIAMKDAVLIGSMANAQSVKQAVDLLVEKNIKQATEYPRDYRPWGWYETLVLRDRFQVKRIVVKPGTSLSLQSHVHRTEHWIVVAGTARITIDEEVQLIGENESVYIPLGAVHRMENPGKIPLTLIEVQSGSYLGEDDIIRYEDAFGRAPSKNKEIAEVE